MRGYRAIKSLPPACGGLADIVAQRGRKEEGGGLALCEEGRKRSCPHRWRTFALKRHALRDHASISPRLASLVVGRTCCLTRCWLELNSSTE